jgi:hypothetical protein
MGKGLHTDCKKTTSSNPKKRSAVEGKSGGVFPSDQQYFISAYAVAFDSDISVDGCSYKLGMVSDDSD